MKIPDSNEKVCFAVIMLLANQFQTKLDHYTGELTLKQWLLLCMLSNMEQEHITVSDLALVIGCTRQNTKKMIDLLVNKGYLSIEQSELDKRAYDVKLAQKCFTFFSEFEQLGDQILERLFKGMEDEKLGVAAEVLMGIMQNIEQM